MKKLKNTFSHLKDTQILSRESLKDIKGGSTTEYVCCCLYGPDFSIYTDSCESANVLLMQACDVWGMWPDRCMNCTSY